MVANNDMFGKKGIGQNHAHVMYGLLGIGGFKWF
jgi:hypothetical protein